MDALKMAHAVVRFRLLRSLGTFAPADFHGAVDFCLDKTGRAAVPLANGAPPTAGRMTVAQLVKGFHHELATLAEQHLGAPNLRHFH